MKQTIHFKMFLCKLKFRSKISIYWVWCLIMKRRNMANSGILYLSPNLYLIPYYTILYHFTHIPLLTFISYFIPFYPCNPFYTTLLPINPYNTIWINYQSIHYTTMYRLCIYIHL